MTIRKIGSDSYTANGKPCNEARVMQMFCDWADDFAMVEAFVNGATDYDDACEAVDNRIEQMWADLDAGLEVELH